MGKKQTSSYSKKEVEKANKFIEELYSSLNKEDISNKRKQSND
jgi:hypothetical protein